jgi:hypothetical protein
MGAIQATMSAMAVTADSYAGKSPESSPYRQHNRQAGHKADVDEHEAILRPACANVVPEHSDPHVAWLPEQAQRPTLARHLVTTKQHPHRKPRSMSFSLGKQMGQVNSISSSGRST